jgi:hypothetical protein
VLSLEPSGIVHSDSRARSVFSRHAYTDVDALDCNDEVDPLAFVLRYQNDAPYQFNIFARDRARLTTLIRGRVQLYSTHHLSDNCCSDVDLFCVFVALLQAFLCVACRHSLHANGRFVERVLSGPLERFPLGDLEDVPERMEEVPYFSLFLRLPPCFRRSSYTTFAIR